MKRTLKNENGYSLLLTLVIVLLFSILGASLLAMTFNGVAKNDNRENLVQSNDLATKAENYIIANMNLDIQNKIKEYYTKNNILKNENFNTIFNEVISIYSCPTSDGPIPNGTKLKQLNNAIPENKATSKTEVCVHKVEPFEDHLTKKEVTFKSIGNVNGKSTTLYSKYLLGAQETVEALKYTISTFKNNGKGGNLFLHGGSEIRGNISVENNLFTTNYGYSRYGTDTWFSDSDTWLESTLPSIENTNLFIGNEIRSFNMNKLNYSSSRQNFSTSCFWFLCEYLDYNNHVNSKYGIDYYRRSSVINTIPSNTFSKTTGSVLTQELVETSFYDVNKNFEEVKQWNSTNSIIVPPSTTIKLPSGSNTTKNIILMDNNYDSSAKYSANRYKNLPIIFNGDVYIKNNISVTFDRPVVIKGDLVIGDINYNKDKPENYNDIDFKGKSIYVEGRVKVEGVNLNADANLYVRGNIIDTSLIKSLPNMVGTTRFSYLTLSGLNSTHPKTEGSLIVFSKGELQISNISLYEDNENASEIKGYFYSEGTMELYGFGSNLKINGGISGNNIILNAMKGEVKPSTGSSCRYYSSCQKSNGFEYKSANAQGTSPPRLKIIYNQAILENYAKNDVGSFSTINEDDLIKSIELLDRNYED